jgi:hypothetical protein
MKYMPTIKKIRCYSFIYPLLILLAVGSFAGCQYSESPKKQVNKEKNTTTEFVKLKSVTTSGVSSNNAKTPEEVITNGLELEFEDGKKVRPTMSSITWSTQFDKNMVAVLKVPKTSIPWYNVVVLSQNNKTWKFDGFIDTPVTKDNLFTEKNGLQLPMEKFTIANLPLKEEKKNVWFFAAEKKTTIIAKFPRSEFSIN